MKPRWMGAVIAGATLLATAEPAFAFDFSIKGLVCDALKATPYYWEIEAAVVAAKESGAITSAEQCLDVGDFIGDLMIPTGTFKDCICSDLSWPSTPPACASPHNVCATGAAIPSGMPTNSGTCQPGVENGLADLVCRVDAFCCQSFWDQICVGEVSHIAWTDELRYESDLTNNFARIGARVGFSGWVVSGHSCVSSTPN